MAAVITFFLHSGYRELKEHRNNKLNRVMADANDLKKINDNLGHQKGDELITQIASCLKQVIKNDGNCYRTGGDEFIICVKGKTRQEIEICTGTCIWHNLFPPFLVKKLYPESCICPVLIYEKRQVKRTCLQKNIQFCTLSDIFFTFTDQDIASCQQ